MAIDNGGFFLRKDTIDGVYKVVVNPAAGDAWAGEVDEAVNNAAEALENLQPRVSAVEGIAAVGASYSAGGPVDVATTANTSLTGEQTIDGVTTSASRVLVKDQTTVAENGIYVTAAGAWSRAADMDAADEVARTLVYVRGGAEGAGKTFYTGSAVSALESDDVTWIEASNTSALQSQLNQLETDFEGLGIAPVDDDEWAFAVTDSEGNIAAGVKQDGLFHFNAEDITSLKIGDDIILSEVDEDEWAFYVSDAEGNIALGVRPDGRVAFEQETTSEPVAQTVDFAFCEAWADPSSDMAVTWVSQSIAGGVVESRLRGATTWTAAASRRSRAFPALGGKYLHTAVLTGLSPDSLYDLRWSGSSFTDTFKTSPQADVKVVFASDYQILSFDQSSLLGLFGQVHVLEEPDLFVMGGDYINDNGEINETNGGRWMEFLRRISSSYRTRAGALVPVIALTGNHEARDSVGSASGALHGGNGTLGMIKDIMSWSYDFDQESRENNSAAWLGIGRELLIVTLETDHTVPLADQLSWFSGILAEKADYYRHIVVAGHVPAFMAAEEFTFEFDSQSRVLRNQFWPAMQPYADKIRFYIGGHEHILTVTDRLRMDYDGTLSLAANDTRWATDAVNGIRQIGSGPWGGPTYSVSSSEAGQVSSIDASPKMIAALGYRAETNNYTIFGSGITNPSQDMQHIWAASFSDAGINVRALSQDGAVFYTINE